MGRVHRVRIERTHDVRFLTFSCYQRLALFANDAIKSVFVDELRDARAAMRFRLIAWVIMPEHVHLLVWPKVPEFPVSRILRRLKGKVGTTVMTRWRELSAPVLPRLVDSRGDSHFWQMGGGHDRNIHSPAEFDEKLRYIHENPVSRGLVALPTDYRWSSARWYARLPAELEIDEPVLPE